MRIGFGYDSHRFEEGKPLVIGGVVIPNSFGLKGHSDGDALIHAIIDALLGAIAHGDIGSHFPDTDDKWKGADSTKLLESVVDEVFNAGYKIGNLDATIICERPKLRPYIDQIRARLSDLLKTDISNISIKGKTNEKMDDVGALLGLEVHAVTLLFKL